MAEKKFYRYILISTVILCVVIGLLTAFKSEITDDMFISIIILFAGILCIFIPIFRWSKLLWYYFQGTRTVGTVTETKKSNIYRSRNKARTHPKVFVEYKYMVDGSEFKNFMDKAYREIKYASGDRLKIIYLNQAPEKSISTEPNEYFTYELLCALVGILLLAQV